MVQLSSEILKCQNLPPAPRDPPTGPQIIKSKDNTLSTVNVSGYTRNTPERSREFKYELSLRSHAVRVAVSLGPRFAADLGAALHNYV